MADEIHLHGLRSAWLSEQLCHHLGLPPQRVDAIGQAARTHDIGKYALPEALLGKQASLTARERLFLERHCLIGAGMLLAEAPPDSGETTTTALAVALSHHEWWNGQGYPFGLSGHAIPRCARIVAVADVFDALVSERAYKAAWSVAAAVDHIVRRRGTQFDPECVDALLLVAQTLPNSWREAAHSAPASAVAPNLGAQQPSWIDIDRGLVLRYTVQEESLFA